MFQDPNLFPWLSVRRNIQAGLVARGVLRRRRHEVEEFMRLMGLEAIYPNGKTEMLNCARFYFNWHLNYTYADDAAPWFPKGTIIRVTSWYDNTKANPNNPDPDQWVGFGDRTVDEMGHAWMNVTYVSDEDYNAWAAKHKNALAVSR